LESNNIPKLVSGQLQTAEGKLARPDVLYTSLVREKPARPTSDALITPLFVWQVFVQWWYVVIPLGILLAAGSAVIVFALFTPVYRASAVLHIASRAPYIAYEADEPPMPSEEFVETQIELLRSPLVLETVLLNPEVAELPVVASQSKPEEWLADRVTIKQVGNSELYNVYLDNPSPVISSLLVNAIIDSYFDVRRKDDDSRTARVIELLQKEKEARSVDVQRLREKMRQLSQETLGRDPFTDLPTGRTDSRHPLQTLQEDLTTAEVERKLLAVEIQALEEAIAKEEVAVPAVQVEMAIDSSEEIRELRSLLATKKAALRRVESSAAQGKNDPSYRRMEREIAAYERAINSAVETARPNVSEQLQSIAALDRRDALANLKNQLTAKQAKEDILRGQFAEQAAQIGKSGDKSLELEFTRSELEREEKVFELIAERLVALSTEMRAPGRVTVLKRAEPPRYPVEKIPLRNLALAVLASCVAPFGVSLLWEMSLRRISDAKQLAQHTHCSIVREVSTLPASTGKVSARSRRLFEECIDSLRIGLQLTEQSDAKILAVVSASQNEGKTSVASQLAASIARATGEPTLLIDADMRDPDIHRVFGLSNAIGLTDVLTGAATLDDALVTNWNDNFHVLCSGRARRSPHTLVGGGRLEAVLDDIRMRYCNVIIDTPPILSASESLLIARLADRTLFCTKRNSSRERQFRLAYERLLAAGVRPIGVVLNAVSSRQYEYTYGRYDYSS
jgi:capsular exopolysaccharide synthesis family protein